MTLRARLSLAYLALLAVCIGAFGVGVYTYVDTRLHADLYSAVQREAVDMASFASIQPSEADAINYLQQAADKLPPNFWVITSERPAGGQPVYEYMTPAFRTQDADKVVANAPVGRAVLLSGAVTPDATPWAVDAQGFARSAPHTGPGGQVTPGQKFGGEVVVGESLDPLYASLDSLRVVLIGGGILTLAVATIFGLALSGTLLAPLGRMRRAVQRIAHDRDFSQRVPAGRHHDEIGRLSASFNEMLAELERSHAELQGALDSQRRFVADASHELRTPLTAIRTNVEFLARVPSARGEDREAALADAISEMRRMEELVTDLLALARLEGDTMPLQPVRLDEVVAEARRDAARLARPEVEVRMGTLPECWVAGDREYLRRAVWNLVDNALKYTRSGYVELGLASVDGWCEVRVTDTGIGINPSDLPFLFDRFWRAPGVRGMPGSGLGLAITRWVAHAHSGSVSASSTPGEGSTFVLRIPARSRRPAAGRPEERAPRAPRTTADLTRTAPG